MQTAKTIILAAVAFAATSGVAAAHSTKQIDRTQANQYEHIEDARVRGDLTRREYRNLRAEQDRIVEMKRAAKADGHVNGREVARIRAAQHHLGHDIASESGDRQKSWLRRWLYKTR